MDTGPKKTAGTSIRASDLWSLVTDRTILLIVLVVATIVAILIWQRIQLAERLVEFAAREEAVRYSEALSAFRTLYSREVVQPALRQNVVVTHDYDDAKYEGKAIPLPATLSMLIGNEMAKRELGGQTALYSGYPFPWRRDEWNRRDAFAKDAWRTLSEHPGSSFERFETLDGRRWLRYATADIMRRSCVECHNNHPDTPKDDWQVGDVRGILEVSVPLDNAVMKTETTLRASIVYTVLVAVMGLVVVVVVVNRLRRWSVELERRVDARTAELAVANQDLKESNAQLKQFAYVASHDLQSPLRGITGFAVFLQQKYGESLDDQAGRLLDRIVAGCERMQALVRDLLDYSRVESRGQKLRPVPLNEVVDEAIELLEADRTEAGGEITRGDLPAVVGDRAQLIQLMQNLIGNGLKYRSDDPPRIHIAAEQRGRQWIISVRDNGIGIAPQYHEQIFEIFRRLHTQDEYPGTGIGLAVCRRIVQRHGGSIWLESDTGQGSTFIFSLPVPATVPA